MTQNWRIICRRECFLGYSGWSCGLLRRFPSPGWIAINARERAA